VSPRIPDRSCAAPTAAHSEVPDGGELDAAGERVIGAGGLSADNSTIDDGAGEEEDAKDEPFAAHAILPEPGEPDRARAGRDEAACPGEDWQAT